MGVRGLYSFIEEYSRDCLQPRRLHNCTVLIDGLNLAYALQAQCRGMHAAFNGDYDKYAQTVAEFFDVLTECGIRPIVLLDGSCTTQKIGTVIVRTKERIRQCLHCTPGKENKRRLFPLLGSDVFVSVMREKGVRFERCEQEADGIMVQLSRRIKAPVISNDTDFYVYDVQYIPLHTLQLEILKQKDVSYLHCLEFDCGEFLKRHGVDRVKLPLFAALVGNDYVSANQFEAVYSTMKQRQKKKKMTNQHHKIWTILGWLRHQKDLEAAKKRVLEFIKADKREATNRAIHLGMDEYLECSQEEQGASNEEESIDSVLNRRWSVKHCDDGDICDYFVAAYRKADLPRFCLDIVISRFAILKPQVECYEEDTSFTSALDLLLAMSWILLGDTSEDNKLNLYMRRLEWLDKKVFRLKQTFQMWADVPGMTQIQGLPRKSRKDLLLRIMHLDKDESSVDMMPEDLKLFALSVIYWIRFSKSPVTLIHSLSVALCLLFVNVIEYQKQLTERNIKELLEMKQKLETEKGVPLALKAKSCLSEKAEEKVSLSTKQNSLENFHGNQSSSSGAKSTYLLQKSNTKENIAEDEQQRFVKVQSLPKDLKKEEMVSQKQYSRGKTAEDIKSDMIYSQKLEIRKEQLQEVEDPHSENLKEAEHLLQELKIEYSQTRKLTTEEDLSSKGTESNQSSLHGLSYMQLVSRIPHAECVAAKCTLIKYVPVNPKLYVDSKRYFEKKYVHVFSNLQAILLVAKSLNTIFGNVYSSPTFQHLLSGSIFYNICSDLACSKDPEKYIANMLESTPHVGALFNAIFKCIDKCDRSTQLPNSKTSGKKSKRKKRAPGNTGRKEEDQEVNVSDEVASEEDRPKQVFTVSLDNKFQGMLDCDA